MTRYRTDVDENETGQTVYRSVLTGARNSGSFFVTKWGNKAMTDVVTPNFHKKIRDGEVINNPCNYKVVKFEALPSEMYYSWHYHTTPEDLWVRESGNVTLRHIQNASFQPIDYDYCTLTVGFDVESQAKSKALANVDSTPYEFFEDLAEIKETLQFIRNPLSSIANIAKVYKKRWKAIKRNPKFKGNKKAEAKALADLWNQYQFAFAPLVRSIMTAMDAWDHRDKLKRPSRRTGHGYSKSEESGTSTPVKLTDTQCIRYEKQENILEEGHAAIYYEVDNPLVNWQFALGLRVKDIPTTAWQVMPLSFMVDRLYNVQDAIAGLINIADPSVTFLAASYTSRVTSTWTWSMVYTWWTTGHYVFGIARPDKVQFTEFEYDRDPWTPVLSDILPPITWKGLVSDVVKTTDLIALATSRLL